MQTIDVMRSYICWALLTLHYQRLRAEICHPDANDKCCSGSKWNETTRSCDSCPLGYNGPECAYNCIYPYYGEACLQMCDCTEEQCDFVFGCKNISKANTVQTSEKSDQIGAKNFSEVGHTEGTTNVSPASQSSTSSAHTVFFITITLISVCVVFLLIYGVSYFRKQYFLRKQRIKSALNVDVEESVYCHYEEVELTHR